MDKTKRKRIKRYVTAACIAAVVILLAVMPLIAEQNRETDGPEASILSGSVAVGSIDTELIGGGTLAEDDAVTVSIPAAVKLTEFLVKNGETVSEGDAIARVDRVTVMTAISQVQETLEYLSDQIAQAEDTDTTEEVTALAGGTVKVVYAEEGDSVQDVMLEHGALAVLSLDGLMAVDLETESSLVSGASVTVTLSDGTEADGKVVKNLAGEMTVTVEDDDYAIGDPAQVTGEEGEPIGSGQLYVYSPWNATAYTGTVDSVKVRPGDQLSAGRTLMVLEDVGDSASYRQLVGQRQEYEELMLDLFRMYQTEVVTAPCDGVVSGVDEDSAYLLSDSSEGWLADLLSVFDQEDGFIAHTAMVTEVTEGAMTLRMASERSHIEDITKLSEISPEVSTMDRLWNYTGDTTIYTQNEKGLLQEAGSAAVGDVLLIVGDETEVYWFVVLEEGEAAESGNVRVTLLSDTDGGDQDEEEPSEGGDEEPPAGGDEEPPAGGEEEPPTGSETETYLGYVAQVLQIGSGEMKVKQTAYAYTITDLNDLPVVSVDTNALTQEVTYYSDLITESAAAVGDYLLLIVEQDGLTLKHFVKQQVVPGTGEQPGGTDSSAGTGDMTTSEFSGIPSGGSWAGIGGSTVEQESAFEMYGLDMADIAAVTPQNTMTLEITIDELDINALYPGMTAEIKIDALGGEKHTAVITEIGNTGSSNGGSSKYTVELTMDRGENMLSGMNATATIVLSTAADVLTVPAAVLVEQGNQTIVYTTFDEENGTLMDPVVVTVGRSDGETVEILAGLTKGQTYYYAYYDTLEISNTPDFGGGFSFG